MILGLSNELLEHQPKFSFEIVDSFKKWMAFNRGPICLVAHNGNRFDYPILKAEIAKVENDLPEDILCIDSLDAFRYIDNTIETKEVIDENAESLPLCENLETNYAKSAMTPLDLQKLNETTPKKQKISPELVQQIANPGRCGKNLATPKQNNFNERQVLS